MDYLDGVMAPDAPKIVEDHLHNCSNCMAYFGDYVKVLKLTAVAGLAELPGTQEPIGLIKSILKSRWLGETESVTFKRW